MSQVKFELSFSDIKLFDVYNVRKGRKPGRIQKNMHFYAMVFNSYRVYFIGDIYFMPFYKYGVVGYYGIVGSYHHNKFTVHLYVPLTDAEFVGKHICFSRCMDKQIITKMQMYYAASKI